MLPSEEIYKTPEQYNTDVAGKIMVQCSDCIAYVRLENLAAFKKKHPESSIKPIKSVDPELVAWYEDIDPETPVEQITRIMKNMPCYSGL